MLSSDDMTQVGQTTEALEVVSIEPLRTASDTQGLEELETQNGRRQTVAHSRQTTGSLGHGTETAGSRVAMRQVVQLREENRRLRQESEELRVELRTLIAEYTGLQNHYEQEVAVIHNGHQQEVEQYEQHLRELSDARKQIQESQQQIEQRYQELYHSFKQAVEEEVRKMVLEAAQTVELTPNVTPEVLQNVKKTIQLQVLQEEDEHLLETMYLKREVQQMVGELEQERKQLEEERQRLLVIQNSIREQAEHRYKVQQSRLKIRWRAALTVNTVCLLLVLIGLQYLFLFLNHAFSSSTAFALTAPIIFCVILSIILAGPFSMVRAMYKSAPHKKKVEKAA
jgi:hypothetical protein